MKPLRVGVICEGPTDYHAIRAFMGVALEVRGVAASFIDIQPDMGRSRPEAGWTKVEWWLRNNRPVQRIRQYFDGGLFQRNMSAKACDVFLIQMDSDVLDDEGFHAFLRGDYGLTLADAHDPEERGLRILQVLDVWGRLDELTEVDRKRHVAAPAVEATETWCVAAFDKRHRDPEALRGDDLLQAFMMALDGSEGRAQQIYAEPDKQPRRRKTFCDKHAAKGAERIVATCPHFARAVDQLSAAGQR